MLDTSDAVKNHQEFKTTFRRTATNNAYVIPRNHFKVTAASNNVSKPSLTHRSTVNNNVIPVPAKPTETNKSQKARAKQETLHKILEKYKPNLIDINVIPVPAKPMKANNNSRKITSRDKQEIRRQMLEKYNPNLKDNQSQEEIYKQRWISLQCVECYIKFSSKEAMWIHCFATGHEAGKTS